MQHSFSIVGQQLREEFDTLSLNFLAVQNYFGGGFWRGYGRGLPAKRNMKFRPLRFSGKNQPSKNKGQIWRRPTADLKNGGGDRISGRQAKLTEISSRVAAGLGKSRRAGGTRL